MPKPCSLDLRERVLEAVETQVHRGARRPASGIMIEHRTGHRGRFCSNRALFLG